MSELRRNGGRTFICLCVWKLHASSVNTAAPFANLLATVSKALAPYLLVHQQKVKHSSGRIISKMLMATYELSRIHT